MNEFNSNVIYLGTLMIVKNNERKVYKEDAYLIYEPKTDCFYLLNETLNEFIDLTLNKNLSEEEKTKLKDKIKLYEYSHIKAQEEDQIYVDINSLRILEKEVKNENNGCNRRM